MEKKNARVILVPLLQELGVHGCFTNIDEYCLNLIPFDYDLLSMEMESSFKVCSSYRWFT